MGAFSNTRKYDWPGNGFRSIVIRAGLLCSVFLFCSLSCFAGALETGGDSTKQKYASSDPRNPDCPCHKYQQQAENEYLQMLSDDSKSKAEATHFQKLPLGSLAGTKNRKHFSWFKFHKKGHSFRQGGVKKRKPNYKSCFSWR